MHETDSIETTHTTPVLSTRSITVHGAAGTPIVDRVSLEVPQGSIVAMLGRSGAGKSTLFAAIMGLVECDGEVLLHGTDVSHRAPHARDIGLAFDDAVLHEHLSVRENIDNARLPASSGQPASRTARADAVKHVAGRLGITALLDRRPATLSAGERRRCAIARAFAREGAIVLLDEPFANLDRPTRLALRATLVEALREAKSAALVATHDISDAIAVGSHLAVLVHGQLRQFGAMREVLARPSDSDVAALLGDDAPCVAPVTVDGRTEQFGVRPSDWRLTDNHTSGSVLRVPMRTHGIEPTAMGAELLVTHVDHPREEGSFRVRVAEHEGRQLLREGVCTAFVQAQDALVFGETQPTLWGARPLLGLFSEVAQAHG